MRKNKQPKVIHHSFAEYKKHNNWMTHVAFLVYAGVMALILWDTIVKYKYFIGKPLVQTFVLFVVITFGLGGYAQIIGLFCSILSFFKKKTIYQTYDYIVNNTTINNSKKVALVYCTKDDFILEAFDTALQQTYKNLDIFVLDDSTNPEHIEEIANYQKTTNNKFVIVRRNGKGDKNKSGNINNFLEIYGSQYDFLSIMDSDSYVPKTFIEDSLKYFDYFNDVAIVQACNNPITNVTNQFQDICTANYKKDRTFWSVDGAIANEYLLTFCYGHSCTVSLEKLKLVGSRFPKCVSEDHSLSVEFKNKGAWCIFAPNIICADETPPNFMAWKKRLLRWESGTFQFYGHYTFKILFGKYRISEKLYYLYSLSLIWSTPIFSLTATILSFAQLYQIGPVQTWIQLPITTWVVSLVFMLLSSTCSLSKPVVMKTNFLQTFKCMLLSGMLYTAVIPSTFGKFFALFFTKKKFAVTIKQNQKFKWYETFKYNWWDILIWTLVYGFVIFTCVWTKHWLFAINPFLWITFGGYVCLFIFPTLSNKPFNPPL